jgi:hypothetical protein
LVTASWGDDPETQRKLEELADLISGPVPGRKAPSIYPTHEEMYGGYITQDSNGHLILDGKPVTKLYRVVDVQEWEAAKRNGYLSSDAASGSGYTRASAKPDMTWLKQGPSGQGLVLEIDYDPADNWHASAEGYAATHSRIPLSRVRTVG